MKADIGLMLLGWRLHSPGTSKIARSWGRGLERPIPPSLRRNQSCQYLDLGCVASRIILIPGWQNITRALELHHDWACEGLNGWSITSILHVHDFGCYLQHRHFPAHPNKKVASTSFISCLPVDEDRFYNQGIKQPNIQPTNKTMNRPGLEDDIWMVWRTLIRERLWMLRPVAFVLSWLDSYMSNPLLSLLGLL